MNGRELIQEADMLRGNVSRMMITKDVEELRKMHEFAEWRLQVIYRERLKELGNANAED